MVWFCASLRKKTWLAKFFFLVLLDTGPVLLLTSRGFVLTMNADLLGKAKSLGFSDRQIAHLTRRTEDEVRAERKKLGLVPSYRLVDTCAAEFEAYTDRKRTPLHST